jgi:hypothetical protein
MNKTAIPKQLGKQQSRKYSLLLKHIDLIKRLLSEKIFCHSKSGGPSTDDSNPFHIERAIWPQN